MMGGEIQVRTVLCFFVYIFTLIALSPRGGHTFEDSPVFRRLLKFAKLLVVMCFTTNLSCPTKPWYERLRAIIIVCYLAQSTDESKIASQRGISKTSRSKPTRNWWCNCSNFQLWG